MARPVLLLIFALPLALGACGGGSGTSFSIESDDNATFSSDANGQVSIKTDGFTGGFKIPKMTVTAENFDLDGVKLYPGSTVRKFDIKADRNAGKDKGSVAIQFDSPAPADKVAAWFRDGMTKHGFTLEQDGTGLKGTTQDGEPFTLRLAGDGADKSKGELRVGQ
ncbi:hypothetical protein ACG3SL_17050 [Sphingomonas sp. CJ20]